MRADYYKEEVEEESEAEDESEVEDESEEEDIEDDLVVVSKPFKTDKCVVCLSKEFCFSIAYIIVYARNVKRQIHFESVHRVEHVLKLKS